MVNFKTYFHTYFDYADIAGETEVLYLLLCHFILLKDIIYNI